jgi:hypothetical protein
VQGEVEEQEAPRRERPASAVQGEVQTDQRAPVAPQQAPAQLPFTGIDVGLIALMGIMLLAAGVVLRRHQGAPRASRGEIVAAVPARGRGGEATG